MMPNELKHAFAEAAKQLEQSNLCVSSKAFERDGKWYVATLVGLIEPKGDEFDAKALAETNVKMGEKAAKMLVNMLKTLGSGV